MSHRVETQAVDSPAIGRRQVLRGAGLAIAFFWAGGSSKAAAAESRSTPPPDGRPTFAPNAFVRIGADGSVSLVMPNVEMGQAIYTGAAMLLAEELGVDLGQVRVEHAPPDEKLYAQSLLQEQVTGGSTSTRATFTVLREAGAAARMLLIAAAAARWQVEAASCAAEGGQVRHVPTGRRLAYGALAEAAARRPLPARVSLKDPKDFTLLGRPMRRLDAAGKVDGTLPFAIDVRLPGMKVATVRACPTLGGTLASVDDRAARAVPGYIGTLRIGDAVAAVGEHYWAAKSALERLDIAWHRGPNEALDSRALRDAIAAASAAGPSIVARETGRRPASGTVIESTYRLPLLAHAPMEPMNATVHVTPGQCEIWVGTQVPTRCVSVGARICGIPEASVVLHNQYLGGSFGRRLETDVVEQAVAFARQVPYPLKVVWSREEDIRQDIVRPMYHDRISAIVDADGRLAWFGDRVCGGSVLDRWQPGALRPDGLDTDTTECADTLPYDVANLKVEWVRHRMPPGLRVGWWRGVGPTHNLYVVESFIDELAARGGHDAVAYRRAMLQKSPRTLAVLERAAALSGWGGPLPARVGRGVAVGNAFGSHVCAVVEVEVGADGEVRLRRAVVVVDCGIVVNRGSVEAQIQGGLLFGLGAALFNGLTVENGGIRESNFHDYRSLRINETPPVDVHLVASDEAPGGLGELGTAIAAPALNNALFAATGVRLRELPVDRARLARGRGPGALRSDAGSDDAPKEVLA